MNKITLIASFALLFITSLSFSQSERIEFKPRSAEFEYFEYRNDSIFSLKTPVQNTTSRVMQQIIMTLNILLLLVGVLIFV